MKSLLLSFSIFLLFLACMFSSSAQPDSSELKIVTFKIDEMIAPPIWRRTQKAFQLAKEEKATHIVIDMNTYGGMVDAADSIRTKILDSDIPVYVLINPNAASAGALISIACDKIYMTDGANIGAATVVNQTGEAAPDKYQSYMRATMRSTAEASGRNPDIAEAMVDEDIEIEGISKKGEVLTFTRSEAMKHGFCDGEAEDIYELIKKENLVEAELVNYRANTIDKIIGWLISPAVSGFLILIILGGIFFEIRTPGVGFPLIAAVIAAILYFAPLYLENLAANWEILIFFLGIGLLLLEIFVIPGFGVAGISGIIVIFASLTLSLIRNDAFDFTITNTDSIVEALLTVLISFVVAIGALLFSGATVLNSKLFQRIVLTDTLGSRLDESNEVTTQNPTEDLKGKQGIAFTVLYPSGKVKIENTLYEAQSEGQFIEKDEEIVVVKKLPNKLLVRKKDA